MTQDRVAGSQFVLTQEFLAVMLGIRRAGVSGDDAQEGRTYPLQPRDTHRSRSGPIGTNNM